MGATYSNIPATETTAVTAAAYSHTSSWIVYWIIFGIMCGAAVLFAAKTSKKPMWQRFPRYLIAATTTSTATSYFSQASHAGNTLVPLYWDRSLARSVFWSRYVNWFITTPLLLLNLLTLSSCPLGTALWIVAADMFMIMFGLFGALTQYHFRWGYYAIGCCLLLVVLWGVLVTGSKYAQQRNMKAAKMYKAAASYQMLIWLGYPIVWGLAEGSSTINALAEAICYGVLDVLSKVVFGLVLLLVIQPKEAALLEAEHSREKHDISLLEAPITSPLSGIHQRIRNPGAGKQQQQQPAGSLSPCMYPAHAPTDQGPGAAHVTVNTYDKA